MADDKKTAAPAAKKFNYAKLNSLSVVAFALSVGWVGAVAGVITGHFALAKIKATGERGRRLAIAALVIGYAYIGMSLLWGVFMFGLALRGMISHDYVGIYGMRGQMGPGQFGGFGPDDHMGQGQFGGFGPDDHMGRGGFDPGFTGGMMGPIDPNGTATAVPVPSN